MAHKDGDKCDGCGRVWLHREGDGGVNGPISCYHRSDCKYATPNGPSSTTEAVRANPLPTTTEGE